MSPCYDAQGAEEDRHCRERLTKVTRLLCEYLDDQSHMSLELCEWYEEHKAADAAREGT